MNLLRVSYFVKFIWYVVLMVLIVFAIMPILCKFAAFNHSNYGSIMEIKVFSSLDTMLANKPIFCQRVTESGSFPFQNSLDVFKSVFGNHVVVVFVCV